MAGHCAKAMNDPQPVQAGAELLPCPFCGASGVAHRVPTGWRVSCESCDAQPRPGYPPDTEAEAIAVWNTRATLTDELTRLREKVGHDTVLGDAGDALDWALDHITDDTATEFLDAWRGGDVSDWPDYSEWLAVQYRGRQALADQPK